MSEESAIRHSLDATRRIFEALDRREFDAAIAFFAPNAVWDMSPMGLVVYEGHEAIRDLFEDWWGAYEHFEQVLEEFRDLGNGVTLAVAHQRARPSGSSGFVELRYAAVGTWADELAERTTIYADIDEARAAAERLAEERARDV
jgi:ketosteroid isomerase-like protein